MSNVASPVTSPGLANLDSPLGMGVGIGSGLQGLATAGLQYGLGGGLGGMHLGDGGAATSPLASIRKGDQGGQMGMMPGLSFQRGGAPNVGVLGGLGMLGSGPLTDVLGVSGQGAMLQQQIAQANAVNVVNAAIAQQQQQQRQQQQQQQQQRLSAAQQVAMQQSASLGRSMLSGPSGLRLGQMGMVQSDASVGIGKEDIMLPPDAASTLYVDGIPADISRREFAHVFRPYDGYKGSRVVIKERENGKSMQVYGFVDFSTPQEAAYAKQQLQGYPMDLEEETTNCLNISYARPLRNPNVVSRKGHKARGKAV
ncbi:unnamed protein product [Ostreobium quekettii]|uniref:RRM domain-containing protein n=1 Tax=Ostreobium quekettii TaxID=121088 RepID=A0A8S1J3H4_9CHLO|nr:unnamed protein product [Ostreobium quekettii]